MPPVDAATHAPPLALKKSFGDSPLGGSQRYREVRPGKPRALLSLIARYMNRKGAQLLNVLASQGRRTDPKFREAMRGLSHQIGNAFGLLSQKGPMAHNPIDHCINRCIEASKSAALLSGAKGQSEQALLEARIEVHLEAMTLEQLLELKAGVDRELAHAAPDVAQFLGTLSQALNQQFEARASQTVGQLIKALMHSDPCMRAPAVLQACTRRFDAARAALPPGWPGEANLVNALHDRLPEMPEEDLRKLCARLRTLVNSPTASDPKAPRPHSSPVGEASQLLHEIFFPHMPVWLAAAQTEPAAESIQAIADAELQALANDELSRHELNSEHIPANMSGQFVRDLRSAYYFVERENGQRHPLLDPRTVASQKTPEYIRQMEVASTTLLDLTGGDEQWLWNVSRFAHQGLLAFSQKALASEDSPTKLDGQRGALVTGPDSHELCSYRLRRVGEWIVIRAEVTSIKPDYLNVGTEMAEMKEIDPERSGARFSIVVAVRRDGTIERLAPVTSASLVQRKAD